MEKPQPGMIGKAEELGRRDAFHVACVMVKSEYRLLPGATVRICGVNLVTPCGTLDMHGIVDPFLMGLGIIEPGTPFWMLVKPDLVSDLTHTFAVKDQEDTLSPEPEPDDEEESDNYCDC